MKSLLYFPFIFSLISCDISDFQTFETSNKNNITYQYDDNNNSYGGTNEPVDTFSFEEIDISILESVDIDLTENWQEHHLNTVIPFPIDTITSTNQVTLLERNTNINQPAQFKAIAFWPDQSIKAVQISTINRFLTDDQFEGYKLAYSKQLETIDQPNMKITESDDLLTVFTNKQKISIDAHTGLIEGLWSDYNNNNTFENEEHALKELNLFMKNSFDKEQYIANDNANIKIEETGPTKTIVKVDGELVYQNQTLMNYLIRYYFYKDGNYFDIDFTVIDDRLEENASKRYTTDLAIAIEKYGLEFELATFNNELTYQTALLNSDVVDGPLDKELELNQRGEAIFEGGYKGSTFATSGIVSGEKSAGWVATQNANANIQVMVKDFWQNFPNQFVITPNKTTVNLHFVDETPDTTRIVQSDAFSKKYIRPNTFYFKREGGAKTTQFRVNIEQAGIPKQNLQTINQQYQLNTIAFKPNREWYLASKVFGNLSLTNQDQSYDKHLLAKVLIPSSNDSESGKPLKLFGWRDFGDQARLGWEATINGVKIPSFYNDNHVGANQFFKQYIRSNDNRWLDLAIMRTRHFMDIDVSHGPRQGYWRGGQQPAGEIHALGHSMIDHETRNQHTGHSHVSGLTDYYLLTGDLRAYDIFLEVTDWMAAMQPLFFPDTFTRGGEAERDYGYPIYVMNERVRITGDVQYHQNTTTNAINYLLQWWQTPQEHVGFNPDFPDSNLKEYDVIGLNDYQNGTGYWTMTKMDNTNNLVVYDQDGEKRYPNGTNPWMAAPLLNSILAYYDMELQFTNNGYSSSLNKKEIREMLYQTMNYIVKYGWEDSRQYKNIDYFVYSEVSRSYSGGGLALIYPLDRLEGMLRAEIASGENTTPQWYDTIDEWAGIALNISQAVDTKSSSQSYGFYGYELPYPMDTLTHVEKILDQAEAP